MGTSREFQIQPVADKGLTGSWQGEVKLTRNGHVVEVRRAILGASGTEWLLGKLFIPFCPVAFHKLGASGTREASIQVASF
jgi:hypothetical protein